MAPLLLTVALMILSVLIALPLGVALAAALTIAGGSTLGRAVRASGMLLLLVLICMPMYIHAAAWEATAGKYGWIPLMQADANRFWFTGLVATSWIHGVSGAAWVALAVLWGFGQVPATTLQQAALDTGPLRRLLYIALPQARPAMLAGGFWVALLAATEMTVADLYGVRTLADEVYLKYAFEPRWLPIVGACLLPLAVAAPLCWSLQRMWGKSLAGGAAAGERARESGEHEPAAKLPLLAAVSAAAILLVIVALPLISLFVKAGLLVQPAGHVGGEARYSWSPARVLQTLNESFTTFGAEYLWTAVLAAVVSVVAVAVALLAAFAAERSRRQANVQWLLAMGLVLLPGPVVGMAVLHLFHNHGPILSELYQRSIVPTVLALLPRAVPAAYLVLRAGFRMLDPHVTEAAQCDGATWWRRLIWIDVPRLKAAIAVALFAAAIVATADVPATLVVLPPGMSTVGTRLFSLLHSGVRYQAAGLAISFCMLVALLASVMLRLSSRGLRPGVR